MTDTNTDTNTDPDNTHNVEMFGTGQFHMRGNYAPVHDELTEFDLTVEGSIPPELDGWYLRNGPNPRGASAHWFLGDGMVHGIRIEKGRAAWYRNRYVRTDSFDNPFPLHNADGTRNLRASLGNTHVVNHAGKTLSLCETSLPYEITNELETVGAYDFGGKLVDSMTAHPKICPTTGEMHFFGYGNTSEPYVTYHRVDASGQLTVNRPVEVKALTLMHDFALTAKYVIFMDLPLVFNMDAFLAGMGSGHMGVPYRWNDEYGARLGVMRRDDPFAPIRWFEIDPCQVFHVANAYDSGNSIVLQASRYPELFRHSDGWTTDPVMWTWTIDLAKGTVSEQQLDDRAVEFPRIDDRLAGLPARYAVLTGSDKLLRYDLTTGSAVEHAFGTGATPGAPGEAVFVPSTGAADEGNGYYLCYVYDEARNGSDLVILEASNFAGDPVATIKLPHRVPFGFHGNWISA